MDKEYIKDTLEAMKKSVTSFTERMDIVAKVTDEERKKVKESIMKSLNKVDFNEINIEKILEQLNTLNNEVNELKDKVNPAFDGSIAGIIGNICGAISTLS